ncbi:MAG: hypothetical protein HQK65_22435, partial [Desulfamplus sp.]|nr:hypothetical protein [Desulfamplus sp.]
MENIALRAIGTIFNIDLTTDTILSSSFTDKDAQYILGGFGFNTWYLHKHLSCVLPVPSALSPENILMITPGLLTGSAVPASSRVHLSARSPLSGLMGSSNIGGHIGTRLNSLNVASILISGRASDLSYILVNKDGISIHRCEQIKSMDTRQTEHELRKRHKSKLTEIMCIGVGGENLVHYACIMHGDDHAAGRTGLGAVMGSKNIKAIVVEG